MAHGHHQHLVDEEADHDGGRTQQDIVDESDDLGEKVLLAVLGEISPRQHADGRAQERGADGQDDAAEDGVQQAPLAPGRRRHLGEDAEIDGGDAVVEKRRQDPDQPDQSEGGGGHGDGEGDAVYEAAAGIEHVISPLPYLLPWRSRRISMILAAARMKKVMMNRIRPRAISEDV